MPDDTQDSPRTSMTAKEVIGLYNDLRSLHAERNAAYALRRQLYRAEHWGTTALPVPEGKRYTLTVNYVRPTVDKAVHLLFGSLPGIQVLPPGVEEESRRLAEALEAHLYETWEKNSAEVGFRKIAHNMVLLGTGLAYYWWDNGNQRFRFRSVPPENFYPLFDGDDLVECILISRRLTRSLKQKYPKLAGGIVADEGSGSSDSSASSIFDETRWDGDMPIIPSQAGAQGNSGYTTVLDWYDADGNWIRIMGDAVHKQKLAYGTGTPPVVPFPNVIPGDDRMPFSDIDDIIDLNLYLNQLISQNAEIIKRYSNPTVVEKQTGQSPQDIRQTIQAEGGVIPIKRDGSLEYLNWTGTPPDISQQYDRVMRAIQDLSGKPASSYGEILSNQSGVASNMSMSPQVSATEMKQGVAGMGLIALNQACLQLTEKFMKGKDISAKAMAPSRPGTTSWRAYEGTFDPAKIDGWYKNRIKWPSAFRVDDPIYVQNELAKSKGDAANPKAQSQYTTMENLGIEDVEAEIDRIKAEYEDPRLHPERLTAATDAAVAMQGMVPGSGMEGLAAGSQVPVEPDQMGVDADMDAALNVGGSPHGSKSTKARPASEY